MTRFEMPDDSLSIDLTGPHHAVPRIAVVMGGGALKGLAHVGALRAIREAGITPQLYAGSSIGAMIAAAAASGRSPNDLMERAMRVRRRDLFRINHMGMLMERMLSRSIYLEAPLRALCDELVDEGTFDSFSHPLLVTAVDLERGLPVVFGRPGFRNVRVRDAVYASCALPGFFPPGVVGDRVCVDGGTMDNLPVNIAGLDVDAIIAIDVGIADVPHAAGVADQGFASIFMRAATMMMHEMQQATLTRWSRPPHAADPPYRVAHRLVLVFAHGGAAPSRLRLHPGSAHPPARCAGRARRDLSAPGDGDLGRYQPLHRLRPLRGPPRLHHVAGLRPEGLPAAAVHTFSPADAAFSRCCPSQAITVEPVHHRDRVAERLVESA